MIAEDEGVIGVLRGEPHAHVRLPGAHQRQRLLRMRQDAAVAQVEKLPLVIHVALRPQQLEDVDILAGILVAALVVHIAGPEPHLLVFVLLPPGHQVDPKAALRDVVDRGAPARGDGRVDGRQCHRAVEPDAVGGLGQRRHHLERFQHIVPMLRRPTKAAIFDRREHETKAEVLGEQRHRLVHGIRRLILRRRGRDDTAIVDHREEHPEFDHLSTPSPQVTCMTQGAQVLIERVSTLRGACQRSRWSLIKVLMNLISSACSMRNQLNVIDLYKKS